MGSEEERKKQLLYAAEHLYNCRDGFLSMHDSWNASKKAWCCSFKKIGCDPIEQYGKDCYTQCGGNSGWCGWCGASGACCRLGWSNEPECAGSGNEDMHT